jgi:hypothetical protein
MAAKCQNRTHAVQQNYPLMRSPRRQYRAVPAAVSFDEPICTKNQICGYFNTDRRSHFQVYYKIELGRLFDWHLCGFRAAHYGDDLSSNYVSIDWNYARSVSQEALRFGHFGPLIHRWHP